MYMKTITYIGGTIPLWLALHTVSASEFQIKRFTIQGGGESTNVSEGFRLVATIGQPGADPLAGGGFRLSGGLLPGSSSTPCISPTLLEARSVASHEAGEFYIVLDMTGNPASRTSEPRGSGLRILDFIFDQPVIAGEIQINGGSPLPMTLLDGGVRGRAALATALPDRAAHTITVTASTGPGCDLIWDICVAALIGDFNDDDRVTAADKGELLGFFGQAVGQANAKYDVQAGDGLTINVSDLGFWTGFFGGSVADVACP